MVQPSKALILVADDEEPIQDLTSVILESRGFEVLKVGDGAQAVESIKKRRPDLILLDIMMPVLDGWGVMEYVRSLPEPPRVLVVTGMHEVVPPGDVGHYISGYLIKPFSVDQLIKSAEMAMAAPPVVPAEPNRKEDRRTFLAEATLLSDGGAQLARGYVVQLSKHGFRIEISLPFKPGELVRIGLMVPGQQEPLKLTGRVRWHDEVTLGAEIEELEPYDQELLRKIIED